MQTFNILQPFIALCKQKSRRDPCVRIWPRPERHEWTRGSPWPSPASVIRQPFLTGHRIIHHLADGICRCHHTALLPLSHQDSGLEVLAYDELRDQRQVGVHCPAGEDGLPVAQALHGHKRRGGTVRQELLLGCPLGVVTSPLPSVCVASSEISFAYRLSTTSSSCDTPRDRRRSGPRGTAACCRTVPWRAP
jgi:hypothetical protein